MARGFESKMVEFQQEEAAKAKKPQGAKPTAEEQARHTRRASLQLARTRAAADLERATAPAHRRMLEEAMAALDKQLSEL